MNWAALRSGQLAGPSWIRKEQAGQANQHTASTLIYGNDIRLSIPDGSDARIPPCPNGNDIFKTASTLFYDHDTLFLIPDGSDSRIPLSPMAMAFSDLPPPDLWQ